MKKVKLTESELISLIERVINEQNSNDLINQGYREEKIIGGPLESKAIELKNHYDFGDVKYYVRGDNHLLSDGNQVYVIKSKNLGPFDISNFRIQS